MYFTCDHPDRFLPEVTEALTAFENRFIDEQERVENTADLLFESGRDDLAKSYLTTYTMQGGAAAMRLGTALLASIEARTELLYGLRKPQTDVGTPRPRRSPAWQ